MADKKISALVAIAAASISATDVMPITDADAGTPTTYKVSVAQLRTAILTASVGSGWGASDYLGLGTGTIPSTGMLRSGQGAITASAPLIHSTATWNSSGVTFTHIFVNITDTASAAASLLADYQISGSSVWKVTKAGAVTQAQALTVSAGGLTVTGNSTISGTLGGLTGLTVTSGGATVSAGGITVTGNSTITGTLGGLTGLTVASGGAAITGNSSVTGTFSTSGLYTASAGATIASGQTLTLTGATIAGAPTWSSTQSLNTSGNAGTATALETARTINGVSFDGTANITVSAATVGTLTFGSYLTGGSFSGSNATIAVDATDANTASKVVARDSSGNFSAGTITATLNGSAATLTTARTLWGQSFNGSGNVTGALSSVSDITMSGAINGQTISSAANFTGTMAIAGTLENAGAHTNTKAGTALIFTPATASFAAIRFNNAAGTARGFVGADLSEALATGTTDGDLVVRFDASTLRFAAQTAIVGSLTSAGALSIAAGFTATTGTFSGALAANAGLTVASGQTLTLTGATVAGAPTWSSTQSLNTSGSAATLTTTRTIWGQNFNGSANVSGALTGVTDVTMGGVLTNALDGTQAVFQAATSGSTANVAHRFNKSDGTAVGFFGYDKGQQLGSATTDFDLCVRMDAAPNVRFLAQTTTVGTLTAAGALTIAAGLTATSATFNGVLSNALDGTQAVFRAATTGASAFVAHRFNKSDGTAVGFFGYDKGQQLGSATTDFDLCVRMDAASNVRFLALTTTVGTLTSAGALTIAAGFSATTGAFSGLLTASAGLTVASGQTLTLTGATVAGTPTWSSSQAITLSTAAQPNITSVGTLTGLTMGGTLTMGANTLALASATVSGTPTWSSNQAITLSTAAQPNVTSVGTLTSLSVGAITSTGLIQTTLTSVQLRLRHDASNYLSVTALSDGSVTYAATGSNPFHWFLNSLRVDANITIADGQITLLNTGSGEPHMRFDAITRTSPADGDLWFDGSNLRLRVSGVTYTLTKT